MTFDRVQSTRFVKVLRDRSFAVDEARRSKRSTTQLVTFSSRLSGESRSGALPLPGTGPSSAPVLVCSLRVARITLPVPLQRSTDSVALLPQDPSFAVDATLRRLSS